MTALQSLGAPSGASNVVRLPTAAPHKIDNMRFAEQRRAVIEARRAHAGRFDHKLPGEERADTRAFMEGVYREPALLLALALIKCADFDTRMKICLWTGEAVNRDPECLASSQAHKMAMALAGYRAEVL